MCEDSGMELVVSAISTVVSVVAIVWSALSWREARKANEIAEDANRKSDEANRIAEGSNLLSEDANRKSDRANELSAEANVIAREALEQAKGPLVALTVEPVNDPTGPAVWRLKNVGRQDVTVVSMRTPDPPEVPGGGSMQPRSHEMPVALKPGRWLAFRVGVLTPAFGGKWQWAFPASIEVELEGRDEPIVVDMPIARASG